MKIYKFVDNALCETSCFTLLELANLTDWTNEEFENISQLAVDKTLKFDDNDLVVTRIH
jgi:hypothetical protein